MKDWKRAFVLALLVFAALPSGLAMRAASAQETARDVLLDKANYWRLKDRLDLAAQALDQLLQINPNDPDALFQYGELSIQMNKPADAQRYLAKLQQVAPNDPHVADLQAAIRTGKIGPNDLSQARSLAQQGQLDEAVKKYQEIFRGPPPSGYGVEYYMTLAGTPQGWDEARQGLEKLSQQDPNNAEVKLSLAELYTYREPTRQQGIAMLAQLSKNPVVADKAKDSWKQALTWLGGSPAAKQALQQYLTQYPNDQDVQRLLADIQNQPVTGGEEQSQAYADLKKGNVAAAERQFLADLKSNPDDPQALAGLGVVRLRQQRFAEARDLLARALKAAPDQQKDIEPAYDSAVFWARVEDAKHAAAGRNYAAARAILAPLLAHPRPDEWGALMVLADIESKSGQAPAAEATYRQVLRFRPGNPDATMGLAAALRAQNETAELDQLTSRMSPAERARFEKAASSGGGEAEKLRNEAKAASANGDNATATAKFQAAIATDPKDPWVRLDFARFLAGQGNLPQAFAVVDPKASGDSPTSRLVAAMFDAQQDHWIEALDMINSVPVAQRTEDIKNFRDRIYVRGTIDRAKRMASQGDMAGARQLLVNLYNDPSQATDEKRQVPFVLSTDLKDPTTALQITHDAYMRGGPGSTKAGADYANLLLSAGGHDAEAAAIMAQINASGRINDQNREDFTPINILLAIKAADRLKDKGKYADAWDQISQLLNDNPDNTSLLLSAGRIYAASGRSKEAMDYFDKAYQQDSGNVEVVKGVVQGAILAHEYDKAEDYIKTGMDADPQNPWFYYLKAQVAQARGHNGEAIEYLRQARALNLQQTGGTDASATGTQGGPTSLTPGSTAPSPPPNPFRSSQAVLPAQLSRAPLWRVSVGTFAVGLLLSAALPAGMARASDPGEQLLLERANYWLAQHRPDLASEILRKILASNPGQPDALYQQGMLAVEQDDRGGAQQYFDRLRLLAASDKRAAELVGMLAQSAAAAPSAAAPAVTSAPVVAAPSSPPAKIAASSQATPKLATASADSDDLIPAKPAAPTRNPVTPRPQLVTVALGQPPRTPQAAAVTQPVTVSDGDTAIPTPPAPAPLAVASAGSPDLGITAREMQVAQVELEPPTPVNAYQPVGALKPYSPSDTLETYIERDLQQLEAQSNPTLIAGLGYREHNGSTGLQSLQEVGATDQFSFSPWYTGTATFVVLPIYIDAGTPANGNLGNFGANPILRAVGLASARTGDQNAGGVGLLGSYTWTDFSGQFGTTPLGFPVTNFVGDIAYVPKFLDGTMSVRFEGLRQPVTDTVISYAGTHANLTAANAITGGAFGTNNLWGGVVKTGPRVSVFYDNQQYGAYGAAGFSWLTGTNVAQNNAVDALLGAYFRPWKADFGTLRVGVSLFYEGYGKNLSGYTFGQGGYFSPQDFEGLGFPVEFSGSTGAWSYLVSTTLGAQHFNADSSAVFPNNPYAQADLVALSPGSATTPATHSGINFGFNLKGQVEYAVDKAFSLGAAGSFNNGNNYDEGIIQIYLRKTFDWFVPVAFKNDPESIAARDMPASHL